MNVGQIVSFDGSLSFDVDDTDLEYEWDFDNGDFSSAQNPIYVFNEAGQYTVRLSVKDSAGQAQQDSQLIKVGTPPTLNITSPVEGTLFFVGQVLTLSGEAFNSTGDPLDDLAISWEVRKHHADHWHPFLDPDTTGNNLQLSPAPEPEDYLAATNSYLEIIMTATDSVGLQTVATRKVYPRIIEMCVDSEPQGLEIFVDEYPITTPMRITSWVNHDLRLRTVNSQLTAAETQQTVLFSAWSDSVATEDREIRLTLSSNTGVVAAFCAEGNTTCVETARAADTVMVARCATDSPTAAPSAVATSSPNVSDTGEIEEEFPVDITDLVPNVTDANDSDPVVESDQDDAVADDTEVEGEGDPFHDEESPPDEDNNIWDLFDDEVLLDLEQVDGLDDSSAVVKGTRVALGAFLFALATLCI